MRRCTLYFLIILNRCVNADPNFGSVWFYSRLRPSDSSSQILRSAEETLRHELIATAHIYGRALQRYIFRCIESLVAEDALELSPGSQESLNILRFYAFARDTLRPSETSQTQPSSGSVLFVDDGHALYSASDFLAAFIKMNRSLSINLLSSEEKRLVLFGADQIIP